MTDAEKALEDFDHKDDDGPRSMLSSDWCDKYKETIRRALKIAAAVDGDGLLISDSHQMALTRWAAGNNSVIERLRGIK